MSKSQKKKHFSVSLSVWAYAMTAGLVLLLTLLFARLPHAYLREHVSNLLLLPCGLAAALGLLALLRRAHGRKIDRLVLLLAPALSVLQLLLVRSYYFRTGWDVELVLRCAIDAARGLPLDGQEVYFSAFPNNLLLVWVLKTLYQLAFSLGWTEERAYLLLLGCAGLGSLAASLLCYDAARRLTGHRPAALLAFVLYALLVGFSPWLSIPYSDSFGLVFPVGCYWLWLQHHSGKGLKALKWFALGLLALLGYQLKPQLVIVLIAVVLFSPEPILRREAKDWPLKVTALAGGILIALLAGRAAVDSLGLPLEREKQVGSAHYLMMGLNEEYDGGFYLPDSEFSVGFDSRAERTAADLERAGERVKEMGVSGLIVHLTKKTLVNFDDGCFAWGFEGLYEGGFIREVRDAPGELLARLTRAVFYPDGAAFTLWVNAAQALWLAVLALDFVAVFFKRSHAKALLMLALTGVMLFALLFEARARYLFASAPLFILLAADGAQELYGATVKLVAKHRKI